MKVLLEAKFVYTQSDGDIVMIGFADEQFSTKEYVILQRTLNPSEQDRRLGQDSVYIEVNDQKYSAYGGVRGLEFSRDLVTISLEPTIAARLKTGTKIRIVISKADTDFEELKEKTELLCKGVTQFVDNS